MSKLWCKCGHVIFDQSDQLPYKGQVLKDQDREAVFEGMASDITSYIKFLLGEDDKEWRERFSWLLDKEPDGVIWSILMQYCSKYLIDVYECESCGRLWMQRGTRRNDFLSYTPDDAEFKEVLRSEQYNPDVTFGQ